MEKLVIIGPIAPYRGGIAEHTMQVIQALESQFDTQVISFKRLYPQRLYPGESDRTAPLPEQDPRFQLDLLNPMSWRSAAKQIVQAKPIAVVFPWWTTIWALPFGWLSRYLQRHKIPSICLIHNVMPHEARPLDKGLTRWAFAPVEKFIVQAKSEQLRLQQLKPTAKLQLCPHPPYPKLATQTSAKSSDTPTLLFFGLIREYKGLADLLDAAAQIKQDGHPFKLMIRGECWEDPERYRAQILQLGLVNDVDFKARFIPDADVHAAFEQANVVIAPYRRGTQSSVLALAQGYGKPIIASSVIADSISDNYSGWHQVIPPNDTEALANAIRLFLKETPETVAVETPRWDCFPAAIHALLQT